VLEIENIYDGYKEATAAGGADRVKRAGESASHETIK
jgi:hypothetical protein